MTHQVVIKTPANLEVLAVDLSGDYVIGNAVVGELAVMQAEWPEHPCPDGGTMMPGTRVHLGTKLNHVVLRVPSEDPLALLRSVILSYGLDWEVVAMAPYYVSEAYAFNSQLDEYVLAPFDLQPGPTLIDWMQDQVDGNGSPVRPVPPVQMHDLGGRTPLYVPVN